MYISVSGSSWTIWTGQIASKPDSPVQNRTPGNPMSVRPGRLRQIKRHVTPEAMNQLVAAVILGRLDYCNSVLAGRVRIVNEKEPERRAPKAPRIEAPKAPRGWGQGRQRRGGWGDASPIILARGIQCLSSPLLLLRLDLMIFIYDKFAYCHVSSVRPSFTRESCVND